MRLLKLLPEDTNIKFLKWQWPTTILSVLLMVGSLALMFTQGLNLGVDFVGGQMIRVTFTQTHEAPIAQVRHEVDALGYGEPILQTFGAPNAISIRLRLPEGSDNNTGLADAMAKKVTGTLKASHGLHLRFQAKVKGRAGVKSGYSNVVKVHVG